MRVNISLISDTFVVFGIVLLFSSELEESKCPLLLLKVLPKFQTRVRFM
jgi:hypothetical protein